MSKKIVPVCLFLIAALLIPLLPACSQPVMVTSYTAIIPAMLQTGSRQMASITLFNGQEPAAGRVNLSLLKDGQTISEAQAKIDGQGDIQFEVPDVAEGVYTIQIKGGNFQDAATVTVQNNFLVFLETDKPIYKPGQTIHIRALTLSPDMKPLSEKVTIETLDAKGLKIFRQEAATDEFGLANIDLPVSQEPNLGVWKITATTAKANNQVDVRIEEYVLPKYEVKAELPKEWFLVSEPIKGKVKAEYSFGKPVTGEVEITATKYVGTWQTYAKLDLDINGETEFTLPAASYVAGVPAGGGNGNVKIEFVVKETATGYQEKTDTLVTVSQASQNLQIIPAGSTFKPGLPYSFLVVSKTPDNNLVDTEINTSITFMDKDFKNIKTETQTQNTV